MKVFVKENLFYFELQKQCSRIYLKRVITIFIFVFDIQNGLQRGSFWEVLKSLLLLNPLTNLNILVIYIFVLSSKRSKTM